MRVTLPLGFLILMAVCPVLVRQSDLDAPLLPVVRHGPDHADLPGIGESARLAARVALPRRGYVVATLFFAWGRVGRPVGALLVVLYFVYVVLHIVFG